MNSMITAQSNRYVFSNEKFFEHAYKTIKKYPDCVKKRNRPSPKAKSNQNIKYEAYKIKNREKLKGIIRYFNKLDQEYELK